MLKPKIRDRVQSVWPGNIGAKARILAYDGCNYVLEFEKASDIPKYYTNYRITDTYNKQCMLFSKDNFKVIAIKTKSLSKYILKK